MSSDSLGRFCVRFVGNTSPDGHTTYIIKVTNPEGVSWNIQKRYREIRELHDELRLRHGDNLPSFPGKRLWGNQDPAFIAARQEALQQYLMGVLQLERDVRTPALQAFLGGPAQTGERNQARQYQQILDGMHSKLLNLALPPAPLDETETAQRLKKYGDGMRISVLSQPVDPVILRDLGLDSEPVRLCPSNAEHFEALKAPPSASSINDSKLLSNMLDGLTQVIHPPTPIADPDKMIVPFPHVDLPGDK
mmetsp:Transcript_63530/g.113035  ORF Transcript_63530/g.113035 Transcript_63530/m.113035 type:complete len:249 (-) Transcript_63530:62-808(-)|eukprot:CAMPEP_0197622204 /NCGR_PEP_ID=MMETSP1338-20131121/2577_1 /TAXON_ID=43686 ORGANISM="Pelagodinium beii, Strain RCC1491" /NCGR_SAMPLE_ID=MMETSP1338 /ASSEMBLY_ACC=CAM_ASM_000754 /LENGTH=248 /DNA_ID=CAMNT_0043191881 /DNA_START=50 /DNA_END=796 /DNA_ORIENTATION=+